MMKDFARLHDEWVNNIPEDPKPKLYDWCGNPIYEGESYIEHDGDIIPLDSEHLMEWAREHDIYTA